MVQKGKFEAAASCWQMRLKREDLPTFGRPTIPILRFDLTLPKRTAGAGAAAFFGGIIETGLGLNGELDEGRRAREGGENTTPRRR